MLKFTLNEAITTLVLCMVVLGNLVCLKVVDCFRNGCLEKGSGRLKTFEFVDEHCKEHLDRRSTHRSRNSHFGSLTRALTQRNKIVGRGSRTRRHRRRHLSVLVLALTLCLPYCFVLFEVDPNRNGFGETTIDPLCCVVHPCGSSYVHHARKSISSCCHSEGRLGDHPRCEQAWWSYGAPAAASACARGAPG